MRVFSRCDLEVEKLHSIGWGSLGVWAGMDDIWDEMMVGKTFRPMPWLMGLVKR